MRLKVVDPRSGKTTTPRRMAGKARRGKHIGYAVKYATPSR